MVPGSMAGGMSEIYQEGLRIPVVKLFRKGELQQDIMDILLLNVRVPHERRGDHNAQIAACRLGARRLLEVIEVNGLKNVLSAFDQIISRTAKRMRSAIAEIASGSYTFNDIMDGDGINTNNIPICLTIKISKDNINLDFEGTSLQVAGNINTTFNAVQAALTLLRIDADMPSNQGILDVVEINIQPAFIKLCISSAGRELIPVKES